MLISLTGNYSLNASIMQRQTSQTAKVSSIHHFWSDQTSHICRLQDSQVLLGTGVYTLILEIPHALHPGRVTTTEIMHWRKSAARGLESAFLVTGISLQDFLELEKRAGITTYG